MRLKLLAILVLVGLVGVRAAAAQRLVPPFPTPPTPFALQLGIRFHAPQPHPTYWKEGGLIGGIGLGLFGVYAGHEFCTTSDATRPCTGTVVGWGVLGAATGFTVGALIGRQFHKHP